MGPNDAYWVEEHKLMAGPHPAPRADGGIQALSDLRDAGVTHFIDLTVSEGPNSDGLAAYEQLLGDLPADNPVGYSAHPIKDFWPPTKDEMIEILDEIDALIRDGEVVYLHCGDGAGRTGTVVACHLVDSGSTSEDSFKLIAEKRKGLRQGSSPSPETFDQEQFVREWKPRSSS